MAIKRSVNTTNNPSLGPKFNFYQYDVKPSREPFYNNDTDVDFVTYNGSLYVCVEDRTPFRSGDPAENGFLLLVEKGQQGRDGVNGERGPKGDEPDYQLKFDGKQLVISDEHGVRKAVSPNLTGPVWFPERRGDYLRWVRKAYDDGSVPEDINLEDLRSVEEHPVLFRLNSDNTKRSDEESGPGYYIQWKKEGQEEWTNLMSISELMNIALAGVSFWDQEDSDGIHRIHFGHRQVQKATYDSEKLGNKKIAEVELGDVLFDAGAVPYPDYYTDIEALQVFLCDIQTQLDNLDLDGLVRSVDGILPDNNGNVILNGFVKSVSVNGGNPVNPGSNGNVDLTIPNGEHVELQITPDTNYLQIKYNGGSWINVGYVGGNGGGTTPVNAFVSVSRSGNVLTFTRGDGTTQTVTIPSGGDGGTVIVNGLTDVEIEVTSGNQLRYRKKEDNWGSWTNIVQIPTGGGSGSGDSIDNIEFTIDGNVLKYRITINGVAGAWTSAGELPSGGSGTIQVKLENNILKVYENGQWVNKGEVDLSNYYTKSEIDSRFTNVINSIPEAADAVTVTNQIKYYKISDQATGITAPSIELDPTLAVNGGWVTTSNNIVLTSQNPYLWMFERITYSNSNTYQSVPVVIRWLNSAVQVDYQQLANEVTPIISQDITALSNRISAIETTGAKLDPNYDDAAVAILTNYVDSNQKSFADLIVDGKESQIKQWAGAEIASELSTAGTTLNGLQATVTNAATKAYVDGEVSDVRSDMSAADASITNTVLEGTQYWEKTVSGVLTTTPYSIPSNQTASQYNTSMINNGWTLVVVPNKMSAIQQQSDKIWMAVGDGNNVAAAISILADAQTSGGKIQLDANNIILNGEVVANAINAKYANVGNGAVVLGANGLQATQANIEGTITATAGTFGGQNGVKITNNGVTLGSDCTIDWTGVNLPPNSSGGGDITDPNLKTAINSWSVTTGVITANNLKVDAANVTGTLTANEINVNTLSVNGQQITTSNPLKIVFSNASSVANPDQNTLYFLWG